MLLIGHCFLPFCFSCDGNHCLFLFIYLYHLSIKENKLRILLVVYIASFPPLCVVYILIFGDLQFTKALIK